MAVNVVLNGITYSIPEPGDTSWGQGLTDYFVAQASGLLQRAGGSFTLTAEVDFGATYGLRSVYFRSRSGNTASAGVLRLGNTDNVSWRNFANDGNLALAVNASNQLTFNGTVVQGAISVSDTTTIDLTLTGSTLSADIVAGSVGNSLLSNMPTLTIKGNNTGGSASPLDLTAAQVTALLLPMVGDSGAGGTQGLVPAPATGDATRVLSGAGTWIAAGTGTVTSVGLTMPVEFSVANSPVTTTGTLAVTKATQSAGTFYAGPTSGAAAVPTFRALQAPTVQRFLSGSGTYTLPAGALYIKVKLIGAGGGGSGGGTGSWGAGSNGGTTTFGTSLLTATGGGGAPANVGGVGGTATVNSPAVAVVSLPGSVGSGGAFLSAAGGAPIGGNGGTGPLGGAGTSNVAGAAGAGVANTGAGGSGGFGGTAGNTYGGTGGGSGAYIEAVISSPSASYSYSVGAGGALGTAGTGGTQGGAGGSGVIIVEEFYQ